jgi:membrane protease YdiL (CAAX protease family)
MKFFSSRPFLTIEFLVIFGALPLAVLYFKDRSLMFALLWGGALAVSVMMAFTKGLPGNGQEWNWAGARQGLKSVLVRFAFAAPAFFLLTWLLMPAQFMAFPLERTQIWAGVMILYPLLSVWPQEIIYRSFLFHRYEDAAGGACPAALLSALSFGFMHVLFANVVAVALTAIGGLLFASTYRRSRSLALVCIEHALYGCLVFTAGLGIYFYSSAAWGM